MILLQPQACQLTQISFRMAPFTKPLFLKAKRRGKKQNLFIVLIESALSFRIGRNISTSKCTNDCNYEVGCLVGWVMSSLLSWNIHGRRRLWSHKQNGRIFIFICWWGWRHGFRTIVLEVNVELWLQKYSEEWMVVGVCFDWLTECLARYIRE